MEINKIRSVLISKGLKITPQRLAVMEAVIQLRNHPTADMIIEYIKNNHPNIAVGTVYKILETFCEKGIIKKVKTDKDFMRYDAVMDKHHHLYCSESNRIEDYFDEELNTFLQNYFIKKNIPNFKVEDIILQIIGRFSDKKKNKNI
jgi:Fur family peroxide stress response transcriptional regulator